ncbi:proteasome accessory factor PafA2 family protein [Kamptonema cortianum]|nr:proteasome accessory factor PafA2 family protein [Geitlerinema splendidum]MDK3157014.1 proteasome accessory factor PafA2 family protein [Kamptonema cortianum]
MPLVGIETEYGFTIEGRTVHNQIEDSKALVREFPDKCFLGWNYQHESPRSDLRGFKVTQLQTDPVDAEFDASTGNQSSWEDHENRVLTNGARFYNDHGHPEYATPECTSLDELVLHDLAGQEVVLAAARKLQDKLGSKVRIYKNNTDFHGASYGTHENYLVPRSISFDAIYKAVLPILIARQVVTGAGKVGSETRGPVRFQMSQRADFLTEAVNLETLYRRPVFNTRDEPHASPSDWMRLHVISGDANMMPSCTKRKAGLVRLALQLLEKDLVPKWDIPDPSRSMMLVSRDTDGDGRIELTGRNWTTPRQILESYCEVVLTHIPADEEARQIAEECLNLLEIRFSQPDQFATHVDWAAKKFIVSEWVESEKKSWFDTEAQSFDLAYHLLDTEEGLFYALVEMGWLTLPPMPEIVRRTHRATDTRAVARGAAVEQLSEAIHSISWSQIVFQDEGKPISVKLSPDREYSEALYGVESVREFLSLLPG